MELLEDNILIMGIEEVPKKEYTKEEREELEKSRTISDANLLQNYGGHYQIDEEGNKKLSLYKSGFDRLHRQEEWNEIAGILNSLEEGKKVKVTFKDGEEAVLTVENFDSGVPSLETKEMSDVPLHKVVRVEKIDS